MLTGKIRVADLGRPFKSSAQCSWSFERIRMPAHSMRFRFGLAEDFFVRVEPGPLRGHAVDDQSVVRLLLVTESLPDRR